MKASRIAIKSVAVIVVAYAAYTLWFHYSVETSQYNYTQFSASQYEFGRFDGPRVGEAATHFELIDTQGARRALSDYLGKYVVIETGSMTCPQYVSRVDPMNELMKDHPDVEFVTVYVREAHPGSRIGPHASLEAKRSLAVRLLSEENEARTILVDTLDGEVHKAYGAWPNMVYVIAPDGRVAYRGLWNNPLVLAEVIDRLKAGQAVDALETGLTANEFAITRRVLSRAGGHAISDFIVGIVPSAIGHMYEE